MKTLAALLLPAALLTVATPSTLRAPDAEHYLDQFIDKNADPRNDFWEYSVGKWLKDHPIPKSERAWGVANVIQEETYQRLQGISKAAAAKQAASGTSAQKIGDFWSAGMDTSTTARQGFTPLAPEFARIASIKNLDDVSNAVARLQYIGAGPLYGLAIYQDEKNSDRYAVHLDQGGLGLPDRDYYFDGDEHGKMLRREYVAHVGRMFRLLGDDNARASANANTVMTIETELAGASRKLEDLRDPIKNYNAMAIGGMASLTPSIHWREHLAAGKIDRVDSVIVGQPEFFQQVDKSLRAHSTDDWKAYLRWQLAHAYAAEAGGKFDAENFRFFGTILNGTAEQRPRWKRVLDEEEGYLGDALGQLYVAQYFSPRTKQRYAKLTDEIFDAFRARIRNLDWMSAPTKERALKKLNSVMKKVGYPDVWKDYSHYDVDRRSFLANAMRGRIWQSDDLIAKLYKPVDRREWTMTPQTYNAYYNPSNNEIVLPAAIFILPGIADSLVDDAVVYAYAGGTTIGHEITHGFDDQGRHFDEKGNLVDWWTASDEKEFNRRAAGIVRQYSEYVAVDNLHVNGAATEGENLADLGGVNLGWDAFTKTDEYKRGTPIGGLTPAQRYFIGWSLGWMNQLRPENLAVRVKTDVHSPSPFRSIGPVTDMVPFYQAFGVKPGDKMYRPDSTRVRVW
ncbi:MAG TPA: M13 family metallopeptidase [Gemmatimonadaceae bacterium]|nr:M13 family metallopeptidase [Gemmatimonadaceae bacterium]